MTVAKLTYEDKVNSVAIVERRLQATAEDFNDIKEIVNAAVDSVNTIKSDEVSLESGTTVVNFRVAFPDGTEYTLIAFCFNESGSMLGRTISNPGLSGFSVTVKSACTIKYIAIRKL